MTVSDFNKKWAARRPPKYYGCAIYDEEIINYLDSKFEELNKIEDFKYYQIKLKFDRPCLYASGVEPKLILEIEEGMKKIYEDRRAKS